MAANSEDVAVEDEEVEGANAAAEAIKVETRRHVVFMVVIWM